MLAKIDPPIHFHALRDTFASTLVQSGVPLQVVQQLLGHADLRMTLRYAHLAPDYISDQLRANLPSFDPHHEDGLRQFSPKGP
jgi:site-specific recombinase XerD